MILLVLGRLPLTLNSGKEKNKKQGGDAFQLVVS